MSIRGSSDLSAVIASGAVDSGTRALADIGDPAGLVGWIAKHWPTLTPEDSARLQRAIVDSAFAASLYDTSDELTGPLNSDIPIIPNAMGGEPHGNRYVVAFEVSYRDHRTGETERIWIRSRFPNLPSQGDMSEAGLAYLNNLLELYPERFGDTPAQEMSHISIEPFAVSRIY